MRTATKNAIAEAMAHAASTIAQAQQEAMTEHAMSEDGSIDDERYNDAMEAIQATTTPSLIASYAVEAFANHGNITQDEADAWERGQ